MKTTFISETELEELVGLHKAANRTYLQVGNWLGTSGSFICNALRGLAKLSPEQALALKGYYMVAIGQRMQQLAAAAGATAASATPGKPKAQ